MNLLYPSPEATNKSPSNQAYNLCTIADSVKKGQSYLETLMIDDVIGFFSALANHWADPNSVIQKEYASFGINYLIYWLRPSALKQLCDLALRGNRHCLDNFSSIAGSKEKFIANPRGIICHWLAGNIPILGMLSLIQGILTKNANILKLPSIHTHVIPNLLNSMRSFCYQSESGLSITGNDILQSVAAIHFPSSDEEAHQQLSMLANIRIAWGGKSAVESIVHTQKNYNTEDIIFGPKTSLMVIGKGKLLSLGQAKQCAKKAAIDISLFEQRGCNSPHTIFVEKGGAVEPIKFAELLSDELERSNNKFPKSEIDTADIINILTERCKYDMLGEAFYPDNFDWTVLYSDEQGLASPCFNRTAFVRPIDSIFAVTQYCSAHTQSIGVALNHERKLAFAKAASRAGIDRVPAIGGMIAHDSPWDGLFLMDRLVRWCKL